MAPHPFPKGGISLAHRILINRAEKPMKHPITGQVIMPGQTYAEPEESEMQELKEITEPIVTVQTVADPESTKKAAAVAKRNKTGDA